MFTFEIFENLDVHSVGDTITYIANGNQHAHVKHYHSHIGFPLYLENLEKLQYTWKNSGLFKFSIKILGK